MSEMEQEKDGASPLRGRAGGAIAPEPLARLGPDGRSSLTQRLRACAKVMDAAGWGGTAYHYDMTEAADEIERLAKIASDNFAEAADLLEAMDDILVAFDSVDDGIEQIARRMRDIARKAIKNAALLRHATRTREGRDAQQLGGEALPARSDEVGDAPLSSYKARIEELRELSACNERLNAAMLQWKNRAISAESRLSEMEKALEEIASDVGFLLRAIEDQDPYGELRLRVRDITMLVRDARSALRSKQEEKSA